MKISNYNIIKEYGDKLLAYNTFTKAGIELEKGSDTNMFESIESFQSLTEEEQQILIENGFVIDKDRNELNELKYLYYQKFFESDFLNVILVPSLLCNFKCPYCFQKTFDCGENSVEKYFKALKKYAEQNFKLHKKVQISLFGGEPLLYVKEILEFLDWVKLDSEKHKYEYFIILTTNGSLLTKDMLGKLIDHNLHSLQITLDSDKDTHDKTRIFKNDKPSFDLLMDIINNIVFDKDFIEKFRFVLRVNLNNTNVSKVAKSLENVKEKHRKHIHMLVRVIYNTESYCEKNDNDLNSLQEYYEKLLEMGFDIVKDQFQYASCEACGDRKTFHLMPDLSVWKCINDLNKKEAKIGDLTEGGEILLSVNNVISWSDASLEPFIDNDCLNCKMLPDCLGGCILYRLKNPGNRSCRSFDMVSLPNFY